MAAGQTLAREAAVRSSMRRQQVANSLLVLLFAVAIVVAAVFLIARSGAWQRPQRAPAVVMAAKPARRPSPVVAVPASIPPPVASNPPSVAEHRQAPAMAPTPKPKKPAAARPLTVEPAVSPPMRVTEPPAPAPTERSAYEHASAGAAKRMLVSIKCLEDLAYEGRAAGREYFSAICANGRRRQVSCAGAGCKIEYSRPPSHLP